MATIGISGLIAAGKDTAAEYLVSRGYVHISLSALLREEAKRAGVADRREDLRVFAGVLKEREGAGVLALRAREHCAVHTVITSIRHPREVEMLREIHGFYLVEISAPVGLRYERAKARLRPGDTTGSLDDFIAAEAKERTGSGGQIMDEVAVLVDTVIDNSQDIPSLHHALDELLRTLVS